MNPWASRRYPDYKDSEDEMIGVLPADWETKQVRRVLKDGRDGIRIGPFGSALKLEDLAEDGICVYGQENVIGRSFSLGKRYITEKRFSELEAYEAKAGDLLITMMGTSGKCAIVPRNARKGIIDSHLLRLRVRPEAVLPDYFRLLIDECHEIAAQIAVAGKGSIMHGLNSAIVKSLVLPLPSSAEQKTILKFLDYETAKIDVLIAKQQQLIALLKEKRQAVISHAVTKGLNPDAPMRDSGVEWLGEVPGHWKVVKLKHLVALPIIDGPHESPTKYDEGVPFISAEAISGGYIDFEKKWGFISKEDHLRYRKRYVSTKGDILMVKLGATTGTVAIVDTDVEFNVWVPLAIIRCNEDVNSHFVLNVLRSRNLVNAYEINWTYGTQQTLGLRTIENLHIPLPPHKEQEAIARELDAKLPRLELLSKKAVDAIEVMQERRTALISAAVTGKIDVRDWKATESEAEAEVA